MNADCTRDKACKNFHCIDPCPGLCGANAICKVINHIPTCTCQQGYQGDPFTSCKFLPLCKKNSILDKTILSQILLATEPVVAEDPCDPNPCGPNSNIPKVIGDTCSCSCLPNMIGRPPNCRPECVLNADCGPSLACISRHCTDPCPGLCGQNSFCRVRNHIPLCICNKGYDGDPFSQCSRITSKSSYLSISPKKSQTFQFSNIHQT